MKKERLKNKELKKILKESEIAQAKKEAEEAAAKKEEPVSVQPTTENPDPSSIQN